jgi:hypothetical protein
MKCPIALLGVIFGPNVNKICGFDFGERFLMEENRCYGKVWKIYNESN